ncbi:MAG: polysaccharide deacetylase family protein [Paludibacteraceae bacterium]|nr:polysaccharide deacetylase family protein [Paludibacteraceae bacterium]
MKYQLPAWLQRIYPGAIWRGDTTRKVVYLTFDDGPIPEVTPKLLDVLEQEKVHATFFMVADNVTKYPQIYHRVVANGHRIGNHTYHHIKGTKYKLADYIADVKKADVILGGTKLFRPPYGRVLPKQLIALRSQGYKIILWDVLTHDYEKSHTAEDLVRIVKRYVRNGSIITFHDSIKSNERMLAAVPMVIRELRNEGYTFETL